MLRGWRTTEEVIIEEVTELLGKGDILHMKFSLAVYDVVEIDEGASGDYDRPLQRCLRIDVLGNSVGSVMLVRYECLLDHCYRCTRECSFEEETNQEVLFGAWLRASSPTKRRFSVGGGLSGVRNPNLNTESEGKGYGILNVWRNNISVIIPVKSRDSKRMIGKQWIDAINSKSKKHNKEAVQPGKVGRKKIITRSNGSSTAKLSKLSRNGTISDPLVLREQIDDTVDMILKAGFDGRVELVHETIKAVGGPISDINVVVDEVSVTSSLENKILTSRSLPACRMP
ncbi:hypothetical protein Ddye_003234 [Dipteronia dyeriana]|uniref:Uncharacterized protein n=1 Tax=Dipteronia dyeriana TaxID=168575 RepID=A0AAE0CV42_9ROSI|nr:hypothetical protein Ddye_003234 [Dipteronia dyeriana]